MVAGVGELEALIRQSDRIAPTGVVARGEDLVRTLGAGSGKAGDAVGNPLLLPALAGPGGEAGKAVRGGWSTRGGLSCSRRRSWAASRGAKRCATRNWAGVSMAAASRSRAMLG